MTENIIFNGIVDFEKWLALTSKFKKSKAFVFGKRRPVSDDKFENDSQ